MFYVVLTIIFWGITPVIDKIAAVNCDASVAVLIRSLTVAVASLLLVTFNQTWSLVGQTSGKAIACLIAGGFFAGFAAIFTYMRAMQEVGDAGKVAVMTTSTAPFVAMALTILLLKEPVTSGKIIGTILVSAGIFFLNR